MTTRREFLLGLGGGAGALAMTGFPRAVFAAAPTDRRLVVVLLRGAMDGLAAVPPLGEGRYRDLRGGLGLPGPGEPDGCLPLDGFFALHPALAPIHPYWEKGELLFLHAAGSGYRTRSHFDAQDLLESGLAAKTAESDGWLNRALACLGPGEDTTTNGGDRRLGIAVGGAVPLILRGSVPIASWEPDGMKGVSSEFLTALSALYAPDPLFNRAFEDGVRAQNMSSTVLGDTAPRDHGYGPNAFKPLAEAAGRLLAAPDGPRIAELEMTGWDTHVGQGAAKGRLAQNLAGLAEGLAALAVSLGPVWRQSVVVAVTEFGRTVAANGTGGTDHGTASVVLAMGGAIRGRRIVGDWPGLDPLQDDRDLVAANDTRCLLKTVLRDHLGIDSAAIDRRVFPDGPALKALSGLIRI